MAANGAAVEFRIAQGTLPASDVDDIRPVPSLSPDSQSFVVIKSSADLDELSDDNEVADISIIQEHKKILQEELTQFELHSAQTQPSIIKVTAPQDSLAPTTSAGPNSNGYSSPSAKAIDAHEISVNVQAKEATPNGLDQSAEANNCLEMNQSVLPAMPPQPHVYARVNEDDDHKTISIVSFSPSEFGSEEVQSKVSQLIDENMHLKDTIIQNNLSMKAQYDRIVAWQKDVERVHEAHKEKFREAKKCIETLKEENSILRQDNDNLRYSLEHHRIEHDKTKKLLTETSENNLKEFELDIANNKIKELEHAVQKLKIGKDENFEFETAKWQGMEEKLQRYEKELENAYKKIRDFEKNFGEQEGSELEKLKLTEEKLLLSEMANDRAEKEILSLRNQLARNVQYTDDAAKLQLVLEQTLTDRDRLAAELESRNSTVMDAQLRSKKLEEDLQQANELLRQYEETAKGLREGEEQAKIEAWMIKQKLAEMENRCQFLQTNHEAVQHSQPQFASEFNSGELAFIRQQLMQSQKALTESEHNRAVAEAKVASLKNELAELRRQIESKQNESDDLFALRAQLDVYKTDFEAEREAKEEVKREKNQMSEDFQHLHRRNQQMQEEIEILRTQVQQFGSTPRSHPSSRHEHNSRAEPNRENWFYKCPKCNFGFRSLREVEEHVIRCIELDDALP